MDPATDSRPDESPAVGELVDADPSEQVVRSYSNCHSGSRLLRLPAELRLHIWRLCLTWPTKPFIRWAADYGGTESSAEIDWDFLLTCKQIFEEARPVLEANIQLHITYMDHTPGQPVSMPSRSLCGNIESLFFHCPDGHTSSGLDRPPIQSVPFRRFPRLRNFTVCKPTLVNIGRLRVEDADGGPSSPMSRESYDALSEDEKLAAWKTTGLVSSGALIQLVAKFGRGGWLSQIIDPTNQARTYGVFGTPDLSDSDEYVDEEEKYYSTDEDEDDEDGDPREQVKRRGGWEAKDLEVISNMHTILEIDLTLYEGEEWYPIRIHTLLVTVDVGTRQMLEARFPSKAEKDRRFDQARQAT
ncbi:hypothetical protein SLS62_008196 [Diatrype stigma]|uniref:Uncharacterized protein n=1 Tax=Diatrype stigma TaxID=117547 RepID=A0AAN9YP69_9PEZI